MYNPEIQNEHSEELMSASQYIGPERVDDVMCTVESRGELRLKKCRVPLIGDKTENRIRYSQLSIAVPVLRNVVTK